MGDRVNHPKKGSWPSADFPFVAHLIVTYDESNGFQGTQNDRPLGGAFLSGTQTHFSLYAGGYHHLEGRFLVASRTITARYHSLWRFRQHGMLILHFMTS